MERRHPAPEQPGRLPHDRPLDHPAAALTHVIEVFQEWLEDRMLLGLLEFVGFLVPHLPSLGLMGFSILSAVGAFGFAIACLTLALMYVLPTWAVLAIVCGVLSVISVVTAYIGVRVWPNAEQALVVKDEVMNEVHEAKDVHDAVEVPRSEEPN